ncbi:MAG TPA: hypothetical protein VKE98_04755 [Gemmataceae bacterium]|nr:hypothetical protein [Gemmataceae bacterium]
MANRTTLLLLGVSLSLVFGWSNSALQAQQVTPAQQRQIEQMLQTIDPQKFQIDLAKFPPDPGIPPPSFQYRKPAWVEFLDRNPYLAAPIVAAVVSLALAIIIGIPVVLCRIVLGLIQVTSGRGRDSGDARSSKLAKRVWVVVLLLVIGVAVASIVHSAVNGSRLPRAGQVKPGDSGGSTNGAKGIGAGWVLIQDGG